MTIFWRCDRRHACALAASSTAASIVAWNNGSVSHTVALADLERAAQPYGPTPFLVYAGSSGSARVNHVVVESISSSEDRATIRCRGFGRGVAERVEASAPLSLLWPAVRPGDFSLIADGMGSVDEDTLVIEITGAVLHRPAPIDGDSDGCST